MHITSKLVYVCFLMLSKHSPTYFSTLQHGTKIDIFSIVLDSYLFDSKKLIYIDVKRRIEILQTNMPRVFL